MDMINPAQRALGPVVENEAIEMAALDSLHGLATTDLRLALGLKWTSIDGLRASIAASLPASSIVVNRVFGVRPQTCATAARAYRDAGVTRFFVHEAHGAGDFCEAARQAGFRPARGWQKFVRQRFAPVTIQTQQHVRLVGPEDESLAAAVARITCAAFDLGEDAEPWLARLRLDPRWRVFAALVGDRVAGAGALFVDDGIGWSDWGATSPEFRGKGVQGSLLALRMRTADGLGLARVHTCTGVAAPGDPQHSYHNILRCGFEPVAVRRNWQPV